VVPVGEGAKALADLPLALFRWEEELERSLRLVGVRRMGDLAKLDPAAAISRYGPSIARWHRICRGEGTYLPPDLGARLLEQVEERVTLGGPCTSWEPLFFVLPGLLERVCHTLAETQRQAVRVAVQLGLEREGWHIERIRMGRPTAQAKKLERLIRKRLETVRLSAPILELAVVVEESCPERVFQPALHDRAESGEDVLDVIARLTDVLGESAVGVPELVERWRPESSWRLKDGQQVGEKSVLPEGPMGKTRLGRLDPVHVQERWEQPSFPQRPLVLLERPDSMEVRMEAGQLVAVKRFGEWVPVQKCSEPEHLVGEWWSRESCFDREYFAVELPEGMGWMFRNTAVGWGSGGWYWQGWFE